MIIEYLGLSKIYERKYISTIKGLKIQHLGIKKNFFHNKIPVCHSPVKETIITAQILHIHQRRLMAHKNISLKLNAF